MKNSFKKFSMNSKFIAECHNCGSTLRILPRFFQNQRELRDKIEAENKTLMLLLTIHIPKLKTKHTHCDIKTFSALITWGSGNSILPRDSACNKWIFSLLFPFKCLVLIYTAEFLASYFNTK